MDGYDLATGEGAAANNSRRLHVFGGYGHVLLTKSKGCKVPDVHQNIAAIQCVWHAACLQVSHALKPSASGRRACGNACLHDLRTCCHLWGPESVPQAGNAGSCCCAGVSGKLSGLMGATGSVSHQQGKLIAIRGHVPWDRRGETIDACGSGRD